MHITVMSSVSVLMSQGELAQSQWCLDRIKHFIYFKHKGKQLREISLLLTISSDVKCHSYVTYVTASSWSEVMVDYAVHHRAPYTHTAMFWESGRNLENLKEPGHQKKMKRNYRQ